jgi:hypothetical protein
MSEKYISYLPDFKKPKNITREEEEFAIEVMRQFGFDLNTEFAIQIDLEGQDLLNFFTNGLRMNKNNLNEMEDKERIDRVYHFDTLTDITEAEIEYAEKIMTKLNRDLLKITTDNVVFSHDFVLNYIVQIKRISDSLVL